MGRKPQAVSLLFLMAFLALCWPQCCFLGGLALRATASLVGGFVLEIFMRLDSAGLQTLRRVRSGAPACEELSFRVTKGLGRRGYDAVRLSAVCRMTGSRVRHETFCPAWQTRSSEVLQFDSCGAFEHRWTDFHLSSSLLHLPPQAMPQRVLMNHTAGLLDFEVTLPKQGSGVHGIILGDPCISSRYLPGLCNSRWNVLQRLTSFLNHINEVDRLDFIIILGDAFYDVHGGLTADFWRHLSRRTQQVFLMAVPGNHDIWMFQPSATLPQDQLGFGFAQWYAQDTPAADLAKPFLTRPPSAARNELAHLPSAENFFFYHIIGNLGFLGYSGAHPWEAQAELFREACQYFEQEQPQQIFLLGHWNKEELGCQANMDVPSVFAALTDGPCEAVARRMRYFMGHDHCNAPTPDGRGYLVGGGGALHGNCGDWGVAYVDSRSSPQGGAESLIAKVTLATDDTDFYPGLLHCVQGTGSLRSCLPGRADLWLNETRW